jgi:hypothetical protein
MKGAQGIMIAVALGVVGFVCNWLYLESQARGDQMVEFVGVTKDARVNGGVVFQEEHLTPIPVPRKHQGQLKELAYLWKDRNLVIGRKAIRTMGGLGTELVLEKDLETPSAQAINEQIAENERVMWLPVDSRTFLPQHVDPGDQVSFRIPEFGSGAGSNRPTTGSGQIIGPFRILALGSRKGRRDVRRAAGLASGAENVIAIAVRIEDSGDRLEARAETLAGILAVNNFQGVQVLLHKRAADKDR